MISALSVRRSYEITGIPLALSFCTLSVIDAASFGNTTTASTLRSRRYISWRFCSSILFPAFCTITSAPISFALLIKTSMSRCQRSMARVSIEKPMVRRSFTLAFAEGWRTETEASFFWQERQRGRMTPIISRFLKNFFNIYFTFLYSFGERPYLFLNIRLK